MDGLEAVKKAVEILKRNKIRWVHSTFVDIRGLMQDVVVPARKYIEGDAFLSGIGFDGSSIRGFKPIEESDMILKPDPETLAVIPWTSDEKQKSAIVIGDVYEAYGGDEPSEVCSRGYVAKRAVKAAAEMGYTAYFGPELEYFIFTSIDPTKLVWDLWVSPNGGRGDSWGAPRVVPESPEISAGSFTLRPKEAYFRPPPEDTTVEYRNEVASILEDYFGFRVEMHHHEVATAGQIEIDFRFGGLIETADRTVYYKFVAKNVAKKYGMIATFMPKPVYLDNASGMHVHTSLWRDGENAMYDESDEYAELSQTGRYFIGGLLEHARALTAICCPTVNSYKRLVPGFEAPVHLVWDWGNRSVLVRVPSYRKLSPKNARVEYRAPDSSGNIYLTFAAMIKAGLRGIEEKVDPGENFNRNAYEREYASKLKTLPSSLREALEMAKDLDFFPEEMAHRYFKLKLKEWREYEEYVRRNGLDVNTLKVTGWEIKKYFHR